MIKRIVLCSLLLVLSISLVACSKDTYSKRFINQLDDLLLEFEDVSNMYGVSVAYDGERLSEEYFYKDKDDFAHNVFSVTKSVTSLLVGIAIDKGYITSVDDYISDYIDITQYENKEDLSTIQIKHLLTMSSGLYWDSNDLATGMITLRGEPNPDTFVFEREMTFTPGTQFNYSDGTAHITSILIQTVTGETLNDFAYMKLFEPLGIEKPYWNDDSKGYNIGGCDLYITFETMEKIGQLVLNKGMYNDTRVVSSEWIEESTTSSNSPVDYYGYYWWLSTYQGYDIISARGWGGQFILICRDLKLVITTGANGNVTSTSASIQFDEIETLVTTKILQHFIDQEK